MIPGDVLDEALAMFASTHRPVHIVFNGEDWLVATGDVDEPYATVRVPQAA